MSSNHTSVYMRGMYDGFRIGVEEGMTPAKHKMLLKQQTSVAQKVYEHVPTTMTASASDISTWIISEAKFRVDMKTLSGILDSLKDSGLIKESARGQFMRVVPRDTQTNIHAGHLEAPIKNRHAPSPFPGSARCRAQASG